MLAILTSYRVIVSITLSYTRISFITIATYYKIKIYFKSLPREIHQEEFPKHNPVTPFPIEFIAQFLNLLLRCTFMIVNQ